MRSIGMHRNGGWPMSRRRALPSLAWLGLMPLPALASDYVLVVVPPANLLAVLVVAVMAWRMRAGWAAGLAATIASVLACFIVWLLPSEVLPMEPWLGLVLIVAAVLPPVAVGYAVLRSFGRSRRQGRH